MKIKRAYVSRHTETSRPCKPMGRGGECSTTGEMRSLKVILSDVQAASPENMSWLAFGQGLNNTAYRTHPRQQTSQSRDGGTQRHQKEGKRPTPARATPTVQALYERRWQSKALRDAAGENGSE